MEKEIMDIQMLQLQRIKKKISLTEIAKHIKCSSSLLSRFESTGTWLSQEKFQAYKDYIKETPARDKHENMKRSKKLV